MLGRAVDTMKETPKRHYQPSQSSGINPAQLLSNVSQVISGVGAATQDSQGNYSVDKEIQQDKQKRQGIGGAIGAVASIILSILAL